MSLGFIEIILIAAGIMRQAAGVDVDDVIREGANEINIVADENERALELIEREGQRIDARHIEMRRGLVHQQQVRRIEQQLHEREAAFFAAAQDAHFFEDVIAAKEEASEQRADELFGDPLRRIESFFENGAARVAACPRGIGNSSRL